MRPKEDQFCKISIGYFEKKVKCGCGKKRKKVAQQRRSSNGHGARHGPDRRRTPPPVYPWRFPVLIPGNPAVPDGDGMAPSKCRFRTESGKPSSVGSHLLRSLFRSRAAAVARPLSVLRTMPMPGENSTGAGSSIPRQIPRRLRATRRSATTKPGPQVNWKRALRKKFPGNVSVKQLHLGEVERNTHAKILRKTAAAA